MRENIQTDLKMAMIAGEKDQVMVLRGLLAQIQNAEISKKASLSDDEAISLLQKEVKKRTEAAQMYEQGGSPERQQAELAEKAIIEKYLPEQLDEEAIQPIIAAAIEELDAKGLGDMGKVIALVRTQTAGKADGALVAQLTKDQLSGA